MPTYVWHRGELIDKRARPAVKDKAADFPSPVVQTFESYPSPIDGRTISSHRQRERDLHASGSYDPRDTPASFRTTAHARRQPPIPLADADAV